MIPFTRGDLRQFAMGLVAAVITAIIFNFGELTGVSLRDVAWADFGWDLVDNIFQSFLVYITTWWTITKSGIVKTKQAVVLPPK